VPEIIAAKVHGLIASARGLLARRASPSDPIGRELQHVLRWLDALPQLKGDFGHTEHPIVQAAAAVFAGQHTAAARLVEDIESVIQYLPWQYNYSERTDAPDLGRRIAFAELIGPAAPYVSHDICLGFTLIAPNTLYPTHHHPATELYYAISGTACWILEGVAQDHCPGTFVLHPSRARHAMRTSDETLLALYTWSGPDVQTTSVYSEQ